MEATGRVRFNKWRQRSGTRDGRCLASCSAGCFLVVLPLLVVLSLLVAPPSRRNPLVLEVDMSGVGDGGHLGEGSILSSYLVRDNEQLDEALLSILQRTRCILFRVPRANPACLFGVLLIAYLLLMPVVFSDPVKFLDYVNLVIELLDSIIWTTVINAV